MNRFKFTVAPLSHPGKRQQVFSTSQHQIVIEPSTASSQKVPDTEEEIF
jgi:hypothetical protein